MSFLLSDYINKIDFHSEIKILNEIPVESFGLVQSKTDLDIATFVKSMKFANQLKPNMKMVFLTEAFFNECNSNERNPLEGKGVVLSDSPDILFFKMHNYLARKDICKKADFKTKIGTNCKISDKAYISENNVIIGNNVVIEPFATIYERTIIGDDSIIRSGVRIGGEGFEFKHVADESMSVFHAGGVIIGKNVEIQNNSCVDKAVYTWDNTIVGDYTKIDDLVQIAHGVKIGKACFLAGSSSIAGRTEIGDNSWIGPKSIISNGIIIGKNTNIRIGSVVTSNLKEGSDVSGYYAIDHNRFLEKQLQLFLLKH